MYDLLIFGHVVIDSKHRLLLINMKKADRGYVFVSSSMD